MKSALLALFSCVAALASAQTPSSPVPADVPKGHWAYDAIRNLYEAGILRGYPGGAFRGSAPISRNELAVSLNGLMQERTAVLQRQIDELRKTMPGSAQTANLDDLRRQVESLRAQLVDIHRQQTEVQDLTRRFQAMHDGLRRTRTEVDRLRGDMGRVAPKG